jgi:lysophospholipid acyltransferase (LPLAT)-like uncharacterized protein
VTEPLAIADELPRRQLTWRRRLAYRLLQPLALAILRFWWGTCRIVQVQGEQHLYAALAQAPSLLPCYWHQHELFCSRYLLGQQPRGLKLGFLISPSVDGELPAMIARQLGAQVIRGSSTRTGARALRDYYNLLVKEQVSPVITPDGPQGPRFVFKPGALLLAQLSGRPLLPMAYAASRAWLVNWDKFVIPWPFARICIAIGPPVTVPRGVVLAEGPALHALQQQLQQELHRLARHARDGLTLASVAQRS